MCVFSCWRWCQSWSIRASLFWCWGGNTCCGPPDPGRDTTWTSSGRKLIAFSLKTCERLMIKPQKKNIIWNILHRKYIQHSSYFVIRIYFMIFVFSSASFYQQPYTSFSCVSVSSEDDPFLLYATLHSGNHCKFVSRDLMRDHKACLSDGATRRLFFKWQRGHQLVVGGSVAAGRRVRFLVRKIKELVEV